MQSTTANYKRFPLSFFYSSLDKKKKFFQLRKLMNVSNYLLLGKCIYNTLCVGPTQMRKNQVISNEMKNGCIPDKAMYLRTMHLPK